MNKLDEFLRKEQDAMESRQYRRREIEIAEVNNIMKEVAKEDKIKRAEFKDKLKKLGVNIVENERKKD